MTKHTPNCVTASPLAAELTATPHAGVKRRLTAEPRVVIFGPDAFYFDTLPAQRGQNQPLSEEIAAVVVEPVACHVIVVSAWLQWKSTCVWPGRRWWEAKIRQSRRDKNAFFKRVQRSGWSLDGARRPFMKIKMGVVKYIFVLKAQNESVNTSFIT